MIDPDQISAAEEDLVDFGMAVTSRQTLWARLWFGGRERADFYETLGELRRREVRLNEALSHIWDLETSGGTKRLKAPLAIIIPVMLHEMHNIGKPWHEAFREWVPSLDVMILSSTPEAGLTPAILGDLAVLAQTRSGWAMKMAGALTPAVMTAAFVVCFAYGGAIYYFPKLLQAIPFYKPEGEVAVFYGFCEWMLAYGHFLLAGLVALPFAIRYLAPRLTGPLRRHLDKWPLVSLYKRVTGVAFLTGLAALVRAKVRLPNALRKLHEDATPYVRERIEAALLADDRDIGGAFEASGHEWPDDATIRKIKLYLSGDKPETGLQRLADSTLAALNKTIERLAFWTNIGGLLVMFFLSVWLMVLTNDIGEQAKQQAQAAHAQHIH